MVDVDGGWWVGWLGWEKKGWGGSARGWWRFLLTNKGRVAAMYLANEPCRPTNSGHCRCTGPWLHR